MNDLKFAFRQLRKSPGFTLTAILTLALGIGANTAIFTVVHAVLVAPLPYPDSDRIVSVQSRNLKENLAGLPLAPAGFRELEKQTSSFEAIAANRYNYDNITQVRNRPPSAAVSSRRIIFASSASALCSAAPSRPKTPRPTRDQR